MRNSIADMVITECINRHVDAEKAIAFLDDREAKGFPFDFKLRNALIEQSVWEFRKAEKLVLTYVSVQQLINEVL